MITSFKDKYFFLSNFYEVPVIFDGIKYQNNEAAFQAQKCIDPKERSKFSELNPSEAKKLGRKIELRSDWEDVKVDLMKKIVFAKFTQNPDLTLELLNTKDEELVEGNNWNDKIWGKVNGEGQNLLGKILMEVREEIRSKVRD